jgi:hypothetical protein
MIRTNHWFLSFMELLKVYHAHFFQMLVLLHLTTVTTICLSSIELISFLKAIGSYLRFVIPNFNGFSNLFLFFGYGLRFSQCNLHFIRISTVGSFGWIGFGVISWSYILFFALGFEKIKGFIHMYVKTVLIRIIIRY